MIPGSARYRADLQFTIFVFDNRHVLAAGAERVTDDPVVADLHDLAERVECLADFHQNGPAVAGSDNRGPIGG